MNVGPDKNRTRQLLFYVLIALLLVGTIYTLTKNDKTDAVKYSEVITLFENKQVKSFAMDTDGNLTLELRTAYKGSTSLTYRLGAFSIFYNDLNELIRQQTADGTITEYDYPPAQELAWWVAFIPYLVIFLMMGLLWFAMMRSAQGGAGGVMKFSKARTRLGSEEKKKKTFADVAGAEEEKEELQEIVESRYNPRASSEMVARIPKGVLLVGPPGTGKTLRA